MATSSSLQRITRQARAVRTVLGSVSRTFSSDALVEVKPGEVGMVSGIPEELLRRRVVISSLQEQQLDKDLGKLESGRSILCQRKRDPYANVGDSALSFDSEEAAKSFAERHGWEYVIKKRRTPVLKVKSYADNFKWKGPVTSYLWLYPKSIAVSIIYLI